MIYFVECMCCGAIKIGYASDKLDAVKTRLASLQGGTPHELRVLLMMPGQMIDEQKLHAAFDGERRRGEWFHGPQVRGFIREQKAASMRLRLVTKT